MQIDKNPGGALISSKWLFQGPLSKTLISCPALSSQSSDTNGLFLFSPSSLVPLLIAQNKVRPPPFMQLFEETRTPWPCSDKLQRVHQAMM